MHVLFWLALSLLPFMAPASLKHPVVIVVSLIVWSINLACIWFLILTGKGILGYMRYRKQLREVERRIR